AGQSASLPAVQAITYNSGVPLLRPNVMRVTIEGERDDSAHPVDVQIASPGYFQTMRIPLVAGREFRPSDFGGRQLIPAVVSESFLRVFGLHGDPAGT